MKNYTSAKEFQNTIIMEREMETRQEYKQGCRESDIRSLLQQETINGLVDRFFEYASPNTVQELKSFIIDKCVEFNFVDDEELQ
jgi:hypothetical protein